MATAFVMPTRVLQDRQRAGRQINRRARQLPCRQQTGTGEQEPGPATEAAAQAQYGGASHGRRGAGAPLWVMAARSAVGAE